MLHLHEARAYIQRKTDDFAPEFGIILGTGLGALVNELEVQHTLSYSNIPHFPVSTVESHSGRLILGTLGGRRVIVMQGRFHF